jgi:hypothetical protein
MRFLPVPFLSFSMLHAVQSWLSNGQISLANRYSATLHSSQYIIMPCSKSDTRHISSVFVPMGFMLQLCIAW